MTVGGSKTGDGLLAPRSAVSHRARLGLDLARKAQDGLRVAAEQTPLLRFEKMQQPAVIGQFGPQAVGDKFLGLAYVEETGVAGAVEDSDDGTGVPRGVSCCSI